MADFEISVAASTDDCRVTWSGSAWSITLTDVRQVVGYYSATGQKIGGGMKFDAVNIPANATIVSATLVIIGAYSNTINTVNSGICGELDATAATFSTIADYQARRGTDAGGADNTKRTSARVAWDAIGSWAGGSTYTSPDFADVLQEMVDTLGALTDIVLFWDDHDGHSTEIANAWRRGASWDNLTYAPPMLDVSYTVAGAVVEGSATGSGIGLASSSAKLDVLASALGNGIGLSLATSHLIIPAIASGQGIGLATAQAILDVLAAAAASGEGLGACDWAWLRKKLRLVPYAYSPRREGGGST